MSTPCVAGIWVAHRDKCISYSTSYQSGGKNYYLNLIERMIEGQSNLAILLANSILSDVLSVSNNVEKKYLEKNFYVAIPHGQMIFKMIEK